MTKKTISRAGEVASSTRPSAGSTALRGRVTRKLQSDRPPRTAYDLCELVARHIEADPLRYDQAFWGWEGARHVAQPACGTVCCRAGWIVALHDGAAVLKINHVNVSERANQILACGDEETSAIYYDYDGSLDAFRQGTKEYAQAGAAGLRAWMQRHKAHLKARLLKDVPTPTGKR